MPAEAGWPMLVDRSTLRAVPSALQPKSSYQEWQRDRPVEATTTYRRIGKVPSPGRSSCTIRDPPFGVPLPSKTVARTPVPRRSPQSPGERPWRSRPQPHPRTTTGERIVGMRCRNCGETQPIGLSYVCPACFGPLEVAYDYGVIRTSLTRETIAARAPGIWRYAELLPVDAPPARGLPVGSTPSDRGRPAGARPRPGPAADQGRHAQPVAELQGPRGRGRRGAGARIRGRGAGLRVDRQPGGRDGGGRGCGRAAGLRVHPGRPRAGQGRPRAGLRRDGRADRGHLRRRQPAVPRDRRRDRLGLRQHQPPPVLRRRLEDARLSRSPSRSAGARPTSSSRRSPRGRCSRASRAASRSWPSWASSSAGRSGSSVARRPAAPRSRRRGPPGRT